MRIFFNAYNLVIGGGLSVGLGVIGALYKIKTEDEIHVFLPRKQNYQFTSNERIKIHYLPSILTDSLLGRSFINWYLRYQVQRIRPDAIFSMGNYAIPSSCKQLLLLQWPYAVYPEGIIWQRMSRQDYLRRKIRFFIFKKNLRYATSLTVQTQVMKERLRKYIHYEGDIHVIESSHRSFQLNGKETVPGISKLKGEKLLLCMSEYYSHKNMKVLIPLAELIRQRKLHYKILLTIDSSLPGAKKILDDVDRRSLNGIIVNLGRIEQDKTSAIYNRCDALLLPTLLESYGIPYLEAAHAKLPIFTSDLDFAHAMNGETAWYFDPLSAESILQTIESAFSDSSMLQQKVDKAFKKVSEVRSWEEITEKYLEILRKL